ncbi:glycoside hydrolase family 3 N-terminal domain-containing protein [Kamptonema formosum]|uniref:glycoside hydrolase family 3 N-terminal domain-containing protein n=1 Tax=Kamptonema formosum TaxID=331992 RepID=UPI00036CBB87|nr:glycoside hydrolase family 3 N-terminal domain-containing protein [Oscillatoria sp. PCC 10802]
MPALPELDSLSLEQQVAQMFVIRASGYLFDHQIRYPAWEPPAAELRHLVEDLGVGGVLLPVGNAGDLLLRTRQVQSWAKIPLLLASDIEEGVGQRFDGATWFPPPMAIGAVAAKDPALAEQYAEKMGYFTAQEALALGLNWVLGPVVDVNNNPDNPVINVRSFGETPAAVSTLATAFIRGAHQWPVLTVAKHFPGHGDTAVDSHLELPALPHSPERLQEIELPPFAAAIAAGVDAVMSAHLVISSWDSEKPATLSHRILTGKLREELGFQGLIVTDALVMGAIAKKYGPNEAPILALEAGADILLMPVDPAGAIKAVCEAVGAGRISPERIRASVERIWQAKRKIFQPKEEKAPIQNPLALIATPAVTDSAVRILRDSMKFAGALPLPPARLSAGALRNLIVLDDLFNCEFLGHHTPAFAFPTQLGYELQVVDRHSAGASPDRDTDRFSATLLQVFIRGNPFRSSAGVSAAARDWFKKLLRTGELQALAVYGSPYTLEQLLPNIPAEFPYVFSYGQLPQAQALALETLFGLPYSLSRDP